MAFKPTKVAKFASDKAQTTARRPRTAEQGPLFRAPVRTPREDL